MLRSVKYIVLCFAFLSVAAFPVQAQFYFQEDTLVGKVAPDFNLPTLKKESVSFTEFRGGKNAILFFWATWCPHCREKMVRLPSISKRLDNKHVELLLVNVGEPLERARQYLANMKVDKGTLLDSQSSVSYAYQAVGLPWFVLVDEKGMIQGADFDVPDL
jgi:peroxiredoxin